MQYKIVKHAFNFVQIYSKICDENKRRVYITTTYFKLYTIERIIFKHIE